MLEKNKKLEFLESIDSADLKIKKQKTTSAKPINMDISRQPIEYYLKNVGVKIIFTFTFSQKDYIFSEKATKCSVFVEIA